MPAARTSVASPTKTCRLRLTLMAPQYTRLERSGVRRQLLDRIVPGPPLRMSAKKEEPPRGMAVDPSRIRNVEALRVLLAGVEPELKKVPSAFSQVDPVSFLLASTAPESLTLLQEGGAR